jgi:hypothetical protein
LVADTAGARGAGAVGAWARVEAAACARRLAAMLTMLDAAYAADGSANRDQWCLDNSGAVCAHIGAAGAKELLGSFLQTYRVVQAGDGRYPY